MDVMEQLQMALDSPLSLPSLATAGTAAASLIFIFYFYPRIFIDFYMRFSVFASGMRVKAVHDGNVTYSYGERGNRAKDKTSILLLHGFSADKFMWAPIVRKLPWDYHVVALDMLGHGDSSLPRDSEDVTMKSQVESIRKFISLIGLDSSPIHLAGLSLGGTLSSLFAAEYPDLIKIITIIAPAMDTPNAGEMSVEVKDGINKTLSDDYQCALIPETPQALHLMLNRCSYYKSNFPTPVLQGALDLRKAHVPYFKKLLRILVSQKNEDLLEVTLANITMPSQVIWGKHDQVIDVSGSTVVKERLPNCVRVDILGECGHTVNLDQPAAAAQAIINFREQVLVS